MVRWVEQDRTSPGNHDATFLLVAFIWKSPHVFLDVSMQSASSFTQLKAAEQDKAALVLSARSAGRLCNLTALIFALHALLNGSPIALSPSK